MEDRNDFRKYGNLRVRYDTLEERDRAVRVLEARRFSVPEDLKDRVYIAGAAVKEGRLVTAGGRVLGVTECAETLPGAIAKAYEDVSRISFERAYYRKDIGQRGLKALRED